MRIRVESHRSGRTWGAADVAKFENVIGLPPSRAGHPIPNGASIGDRLVLNPATLPETQKSY
eukprot:c41926_g1_i1 orf=295-480(+)